MIKIKSEKRNYGINFPTSIEEITPEHFSSILEGVKLPPHYCVVALCFRVKLFDFVTAVGNKRNTNVNVVPRLAAISKDDAKIINGTIGDKVIVNRSTIERGDHLAVPTMITSINAESYFRGDTDLCRAITTGKFENAVANPKDIDMAPNKDNYIVILEFKIIPVNDISACIPMNRTFVDPFIITNNLN